jgi:hypothetical protein
MATAMQDQNEAGANLANLQIHSLALESSADCFTMGRKIFSIGKCDDSWGDLTKCSFVIGNKVKTSQECLH